MQLLMLQLKHEAKFAARVKPDLQIWHTPLNSRYTSSSIGDWEVGTTGSTEVDRGAGDTFSWEALNALAGRWYNWVEGVTSCADIIGRWTTAAMLNWTVETFSLDGSEASCALGTEVYGVTREAVGKTALDACFVANIHGKASAALGTGPLQGTEITVGDVTVEADVIEVQLVSWITCCTGTISVTSCTLRVVKAATLGGDSNCKHEHQEHAHKDWFFVDEHLRIN